MLICISLLQHIGNSWGSNGGNSGLGVGAQEQFYGCSDIEICAPSDAGCMSRVGQVPPPENPKVIIIRVFLSLKAIEIQSEQPIRFLPTKNGGKIIKKIITKYT